MSNRLIGPVGRVFANGSGDLGSIPGCVIPKTLKKCYLISPCLSPSLTPVVAVEKGAFWSPRGEKERKRREIEEKRGEKERRKKGREKREKAKEKKRKRKEREERKRERRGENFGLTHLFNGTLTLCGLFNAKILFISR